REAGRGGGRGDRDPRREERHRARAARVRLEAAGALQGAAQVRLRERAAARTDGKAAADRAGVETGACAVKICVYGAGAIGGLIGARLALSGEEVTLIARGPHLKAMQEKGLRLIAEGKTETVRLRCTDDAREVGPQDYVILSVKAHALKSIADPM